MSNVEIDGTKVFDVLSIAQQDELLDALVEKTYSAEQVVIEQGSENATFYLISGGTAKVVQKDGRELSARTTGCAGLGLPSGVGVESIDEVRWSGLWACTGLHAHGARVAPPTDPTEMSSVRLLDETHRAEQPHTLAE